MKDSCPKCGYVGKDGNATWSGPTYRGPTDAGYAVQGLSECLVYACERCGYKRSEPTLDTKRKSG
jgi:predicted RNA-binding Zn-ribbon protein involved in translation (DUF1610 family)